MRRLSETDIGNGVFRVNDTTIDSRQRFANASDLVNPDDINEATQMQASFAEIVGDVLINQNGHTDYMVEVVLRRVKRQD